MRQRMVSAVTVPWQARIRSGPAWAALGHQHPIPEMVVVLAGQLRVTTPSGEYFVRSGEVLVYPSGLRHAERSCSPAAIDLVAIGLDGISLPGLLHVADRDGRLRQLSAWLDEARWLPAGLAAQVRDAHAVSLLAELSRLSAPPIDQAVTQVREHLRRHFDRAHSLESLAALAGLGRSAFCRRYRKATGHSPMDDLRHLRIQAAADLLRATSETLETIAATTGFCDVFHLSRIFRQQMGVSPGRYRTRFHNGRRHAGADT